MTNIKLAATAFCHEVKKLQRWGHFQFNIVHDMIHPRNETETIRKTRLQHVFKQPIITFWLSRSGHPQRLLITARLQALLPVLDFQLEGDALPLKDIHHVMKQFEESNGLNTTHFRSLVKAWLLVIESTDQSNVDHDDEVTQGYTIPTSGIPTYLSGMYVSKEKLLCITC
jgi:hypothetical protein